MRKLARLGAFVGALLVGALSVTGGPAYAGSVKSDVVKGERHCRTVLEKLRPGEQVSRVRSFTCAEKKEDLNINAGTLLITWYQHAKYEGLSNAVEGCCGPCDRSGYGIRDVGNVLDPWGPFTWRVNISSLKVWNGCAYTHLYTNLDYGGSESIKFYHQENLGDMNDRVLSLRVHS